MKILNLILILGVCVMAKAELSKSGTLGSFVGAKENFSGKVKVDMLFKENEWRNFSGALVEFAPKARSAWHTHPAGQSLIVTQGEIISGSEDGQVWLAKKGDVLSCPPNIKHWHGGSDLGGAHLALTGSKEGEAVKWLELVSDEEYEAALKKLKP
ncbi:cupin domain-containing protein [Campylobacter sp. VTCC 70190]|uniref:cupin domain-containing protein n=1 Tax=Campylobacter sp. VTCC 70190 TaxID=3392118 RepID=UPI00398F1EF0